MSLASIIRKWQPKEHWWIRSFRVPRILQRMRIVPHQWIYVQLPRPAYAIKRGICGFFGHRFDELGLCVWCDRPRREPPAVRDL
ncbi:MAG: hypothetical protein JNL98_17735 [Bryobacterales bacterium]|nr:hypothetical protein [Bryobacterales bacterium]